MNRTRLVRYGLPVLLLTISLTTLALSQHHSTAPLQLQSTPVASAKAEPSATPEPHVTVDGQPVQLGADGTATVSLPSSKTTVRSGSGTTTVTTDATPHSTSTVSGDGNLNVSVQSSTTGGTSSSSTQVQSSSSGTSWDSSSSFTSLNVSQ